MVQREGTRKQAENFQKRTELQTVNIQRNPYLAAYDDRRNTGVRRPEERTRKPETRKIPEPSARIFETRYRNFESEGKQRRVARRRRREKMRRRRLLVTACVCIFIMCIWLYRVITDAPEVDGSVPPAGIAGQNLGNALSEQKMQGLDAADYLSHPIWTEDFLTVNEYSRPGDALKEVKNIFVHYTANKGTSAAQNRSYFEGLKDSRERSASAHFIIGYEGEIIQCVPLNEIAYAVQGRNGDSVSIECCFTEEDGSFTQETYDSLIELLQWLTKVYDLDSDDILRHYDCGGKKCPIYYVENEDAWEQLKRDVEN